MGSMDAELRPAATSRRYPPQPFTFRTDSEQITTITIECPEDNSDFAMTKRTPAHGLEIMVRRQLTLRAVPSIDSMLHGTLHLIADNANPTSIDVHVGFAVLTCSAQPVTPNRRWHELTAP